MPGKMTNEFWLNNYIKFTILTKQPADLDELALTLWFLTQGEGRENFSTKVISASTVSYSFQCLKSSFKQWSYLLGFI